MYDFQILQALRTLLPWLQVRNVLVFNVMSNTQPTLSKETFLYLYSWLHWNWNYFGTLCTLKSCHFLLWPLGLFVHEHEVWLLWSLSKQISTFTDLDSHGFGFQAKDCRYGSVRILFSFPWKLFVKWLPMLLLLLVSSMEI